MNKIYYLLLLFAIVGSNYSFADCITGYACSLDSIQAKNIQLEEQFLKELNKYFELSINEDFMLGKADEKTHYKDFFPFTNLLNISNEKLKD